MLDLGAFKISQQIGHGGMGEVFAGVHRGTGLRVAVKLLAGEMAADARFRRVFRREVEAVAGLDHPSIVMVYDHGITPVDADKRSSGAIVSGAPYLVMEFAGGGALDDSPPDSWRGARRTLLSILDGLAHAHARGVIHRDLKPANVLLCGPNDNRPGIKLADFGLAHMYAQGKAMAVGAGTPGYMAPEQVRGSWRDFGPWTDLYALGALAWEWITGVPLFAGDLTTLRQHHLTAAPPPLAPHFEVPDGIEAWLLRLLAKEPADRTQNAATASRELLALGTVAGEPITEEVPLQGPATFFTLVPDLADLDDDELEAYAQWDMRSTAPPAPFPRTWKPRPSMRPPGGVPGAGLGLFAVREPPFVGRLAERDAIWKVLEQAVEIERVRGVVLTGPTGFGKSRLARWIAQRALELGIATVWSTRHSPDDDNSERVAELRAHLLQEHAGPAIVVLDDLQWGESARRLARDVLRMAALVERSVLFLLVADAPTAPIQVELEDLAALQAVTTVEVGPMPDSDMVELVTQMLGVDQLVVSQVTTRSMGSPLVAIQVLRGWIQQGDLESRRDGFTLTTEASVPRDLSDLWIGRLAPFIDPLKPEERQAVLLAAILGSTVDEVQWAAACKRAALPFPLEFASVLARAGIVEQAAQGFRWQQELAREALVERARAEGHFAHLSWVCAELLRATDGSPERIGRHLAASGAFGEAFDPLITGIHTRLDADDYGQALELLELAERCLERSGAEDCDERYATVAIRRILCRVNLWEMERGFREGEQLVARCDAKGWRLSGAEARSLLGLAAFRLGRFDDGVRWLEEANAHPTPARIEVRIARGLGQIAQSRMQLDAARQHFERFAELGGELESPFHRACAYNDLSNVAELGGDVAEAERLVRLGLQICEEHGFRDALVARLNLCGHVLRRGAVEEGLALLRGVLDNRDAAWSPFVRVMAHAMSLRIHTLRSDWEAWDESRYALDALLRYQTWTDQSMALELDLACDEAAEKGEFERSRYLGEVALGQWVRLDRGPEAEALRERLAALPEH